MNCFEINEEICRARPVEDTLTPQKKTAKTIRQEVEREVSAPLRLVFADQRKSGRLDLETVEMAMRAAYGFVPPTFVLMR